MKVRSLIGQIIYLATAVLSGCGGGDSAVSPTTQQGAQPTAATLKLSTQGVLPTGASIGAVDVVVNLPAGVTVKADGSGQVQAGAMEPSAVAVGSTAIATFTPTSGGSPAKTRVVLINAAGFGTGEFATVNCDIAAGSSPKAADFTLTGFSAANVDGTTLTGLTPVVSADFK